MTPLHSAHSRGSARHLFSPGPVRSGLFQESLPRRPRILLLSAAVGTGHVRTAQALELVLKETLPEAQVENVDILKLSTYPFRRCYAGMYLDFIDLAPQVLGFFYNLMDQAKPAGQSAWDHLRVSLEKMSMRPFVQLLEAQPWDLIINTHFLPAEIVASLRRQKRINTPQVTVTTDFETHRLWVNEPCELYFTATEEAALYLECFGVPRARAIPCGIPVLPVFAEPKTQEECRKRQQIQGGRPVVLLLSGGHGVGPFESLYRSMLEVEVPLELVVVTGTNTEARRRMSAIPTGAHRAHVLGYTHQMDELMTAADLVVSKPGGLTTSELLARGAPLVIVHPVPGQEDRNSDYLLENGAAIKVNHLPTLAHKVTALLRDPQQLARLQANSRRLGRPRAAYEVVDYSLSLLQRRALQPAGLASTR
jgi:processive 1,2-diacylglycerol beta-glucosyltransferase